MEQEHIVCDHITHPLIITLIWVSFLGEPLVHIYAIGLIVWIYLPYIIYLFHYLVIRVFESLISTIFALSKLVFSA